MDGVAAVNAIFLVGSFLIVAIILWGVPVRLWIEALSESFKKPGVKIFTFRFVLLLFSCSCRPSSSVQIKIFTRSACL